MKQIYLSLALLISFIAAKAQDPEAIYIATWTTMSELGTAIMPNTEDPKLTYNSETGCYEGEIIDWPRLSVNPYIAKIPYSVDNDEITYYGVAGPTQSFIFNTKDSQSFEFTSSSSPASYKGFGLAMQNAESVVDVKISMDLSTNTITFTKFESGKGMEIPELISVYPENGSNIPLNEEGGVTIVLTFTGEVNSLEAISDGSTLPVESGNEGTTWSILVPKEKINEVASSSLGILSLNVQKAYSNNLPVSFENGSSTLNLSYTIEGITHFATLDFEGSEEALNTLKVYKSPEYSVGDEMVFENNILEFSYTKSVTYLFTAGAEYEVAVTSSIESDNGENWKLGEGYSTEKGPNGETTNKVAAEGITLTILSNADGATFNINLAPKEAGVNSIMQDKETLNVYDINGVRVLTSKTPVSINNLPSGLYIVNGKKIRVK